MRYIRGFIHGAVVGGLAGLCLAPQEGAITRAQVRSAAASLRDGLVRAQGTAARVAPVVEGTAQRMIVVVGKARRSRQRNGTRPPDTDAAEREGAPAPEEWPAGSSTSL